MCVKTQICDSEVRLVLYITPSHIMVYEYFSRTICLHLRFLFLNFTPVIPADLYDVLLYPSLSSIYKCIQVLHIISVNYIHKEYYRKQNIYPLFQ